MPKQIECRVVKVDETLDVRLRERQVLFAFDDESLPGVSGLHLEMRRPDKHPANPIVPRGEDGAPDARRAQCAAVLREGDRWRMWYSAHDGSGAHRVAYAESADGIAWHKPDLGLVEYGGNRCNNLVDAKPGLNTVAVLCDPDAPAERRYVMAGEDMLFWKGGAGWSLTGPAMTRLDTSPDGLHWTPILDRPGLFTPQHEAMTLYRFGGQYHLGGHQISPLLRLPMQEHPLGYYLGPRTFVVWRSPRLDRWPLEPTRAFYKPMRSSSPYRSGWDREEVHLGAVVTPVGNVCLGVYGQWHHPIGRKANAEEADAARGVEGGYQSDGSLDYLGAEVSVDLGLLISNDGLHFREPAPGYTFIGRDQELAWDRDFRDNTDRANILLLQGSIVNTPERTFVYYSASTPGGNAGEIGENIGVATLPRDRFGCLRVLPGETAGTVVSKPLTAAAGTTVRFNAEVPAGSTLRIALLDADGIEELPGYGLAEMRGSVASGLDTPVRWQTRDTLPANTPFRVRVEATGEAELYALYL